MFYLPLNNLMAVAVVALLAASTLAVDPADAIVLRNGCAGGNFGANCSLSELAISDSIIIDDKRFDYWSFISGELS